MWRKSIIVFISSIALFSSCTGVKINELRIPGAIANGTVPFAVLDCDFTYDIRDLPSLVVKWFLNSNPQPVYQWIPPQKPQALGPLSHRLDLDYQASEDNYTMHRALKIIQPTYELSGDYRCQVSSFEGEDDKWGTFVIYAAATFVKIDYRSAGNDLVNISCVATGLYPKPTAEMVVIKGRKQSRNSVPSTTIINQSSTGLYTISLHRIFEERKLSAETVFECDFSIPSTDYSVYDRLTYYPGAVTPPISHVKSLVFSTEPSFIGVPEVSADNGSPPTSLQVPPTLVYALPFILLVFDQLTMALCSLWC
ncbi:hypothetical protein CHUAL_002352 [Chamberlinius hualienensis]